jgi:alpha 1,3-glucosidase
MRAVISLFILLLAINFCIGVDRSKFKTCEQAAFCKRHRNQEKTTNYIVDAASVKANETGLQATLKSEINNLKLELVLLKDNVVRILLDEAGTPLRPRFQPLIALNGTPVHERVTAAESNPESASFVTPTGFKIILNFNPFRIDVFNSKKELVVSVNSKNLLKFEHFREKGADAGDDGFWEENFGGHKDSKPFGSSSVGLDVSFIGFKFLYGLPEHADTFALKSTTNSEPYRLYNLDVFEYELNNGMSLYGAVPYVIANNPTQSIGAFWLNAAETWVDIASSTADKGVLASIVDKFKASKDVPQMDAHFISESGLAELYLILGPKPYDIFRQYASLTGVYPLPPLFSVAYHQCRWNYNDEDDVAMVNEGFDKHDIPMDALWLDIEHTDSKKYFTWDPVKFSNPQKMIDGLSSKGRKLITISDPHIKKDDNYPVYKEAKDQGYYVKNVDGNDFEGHCWPGASLYLDYMNPEVRNYWASRYHFDKYIGTDKNLHVWNDMNEPSVFSGPEVTMNKDARHFGDWEHRDVHNIYGFLQTISTHKGLVERADKKVRPFILTRSFFAGSQRVAAVWTGDNTADWDHLRISIPMMLSLSVAGIPHVGADVGGFFKNVDEQLLVRWYQMGAFSPFFRAHAHIDCKRREPWLFSDTAINAIRNAIRKRYSFLPYWYTLFYEHTKTGLPIIRPLWSEFPEDEQCYDEEREFLIGNGLLVRPIAEPDVTQVSLYLPGRRQVWYEWNNDKTRPSPGAVYVDATLESIPVFQRGGTIIPTRQRPRRSSALMKNDPLTLYVASDTKDFANGTIYLDDGESYDYENGQYLYWGFTYKKESDFVYTITSKNLDPKGEYDPDVYIEKIVVRGVRYYPRNVHLYYDDYNPEGLEFEHIRDKHLIVIRKPGAYVSREWRIDIHT